MLVLCVEGNFLCISKSSQQGQSLTSSDTVYINQFGAEHNG